MSKTIIRFGFPLSLSLLLHTGAVGQSDDWSAAASFGPRFGYALPSGEWSVHRYAGGVDFFKGSMAWGADLEFRLSDRWTLAVDGAYWALNASDWEDYARNRGDEITVTGSIAYASILLRPHLKISMPDIIKIELGPVIVFASGEETFAGNSYDYDFFKSFKVGAQGGIEYDRILGKSFALCMRLTGIVVPSGIEYADGESRTLIAVPVTIGLRLFM